MFRSPNIVRSPSIGFVITKLSTKQNQCCVLICGTNKICLTFRHVVSSSEAYRQMEQSHHYKEKKQKEMDQRGQGPSLRTPESNQR